jgi:hypothetical protein
VSCWGGQGFGARQRGTTCTVWRKLLCPKHVQLILEINKTASRWFSILLYLLSCVQQQYTAGLLALGTDGRVITIKPPDQAWNLKYPNYFLNFLSRDFRLPPLCKWDLRSSGTLPSVDGLLQTFRNYISFPSSRIKVDSAHWKWDRKVSRNVGTTNPRRLTTKKSEDRISFYLAQWFKKCTANKIYFYCQ